MTMRDRDPAARAREHAKFLRHLDELEAAGRLASLLDADGRPFPVHVAAYFRARWFSRRLVEKLVERGRKRDARRPIVRVIIDHE
jgi:hypothetical protein